MLGYGAPAARTIRCLNHGGYANAGVFVELSILQYYMAIRSVQALHQLPRYSFSSTSFETFGPWKPEI